MTDTITSVAFVLPLDACEDVARVGGKAANLGKMIRAGLPVPGGFAVTTDAFHGARMVLRVTKFAGGCWNAAGLGAIAETIREAYRAMGSPAVAVRSSATAEDMADASMAGQYESYLDIRGEEALLDAIHRCWESIDSPRIQAYFREHGIDAARVSMAVVVQELVPADVSGVLFTANPNAAVGRARQEMLLEATWGLGEMLVSGRVQPDVFRLDSATGHLLSRVIGDKQLELTAGSHEPREVAALRRQMACVNDASIATIWALGKKAADHFVAPQDIEWAMHDGNILLLQARPITTLRAADAQARILAETREHLRQELAHSRGPWVLHNLAETLPHPTPLTWSVLRRFMSGAGGFGAMYRQAGFEPSEAVSRDGFLELIAGRIYMDASRAPEMFFADFPFAYDVEVLKCAPDASQAPPTHPKGSLRARMRAGRRLAGAEARLRDLSRDLDRELVQQLFPAINNFVADARLTDLRTLKAAAWIEHWRHIEQQVLHVFAPRLLLPSLICGMALEDVRAFIAEHFWRSDDLIDASGMASNPEGVAQMLSSGGGPDGTVLSDAALFEVGKGNRSLESWLETYGHRAPGEFDLAAPRWREEPDAVRAMAQRLAGGDDPLERFRNHAEKVREREAALRAKLGAKDRAEFADGRDGLARRHGPARPPHRRRQAHRAAQARPALCLRQ